MYFYNYFNRFVYFLLNYKSYLLCFYRYSYSLFYKHNIYVCMTELVELVEFDMFDVIFDIITEFGMLWFDNVDILLFLFLFYININGNDFYKNFTIYIFVNFLFLFSYKLIIFSSFLLGIKSKLNLIIFKAYLIICYYFRINIFDMLDNIILFCWL